VLANHGVLFLVELAKFSRAIANLASDDRVGCAALAEALAYRAMLLLA
jgi:predicted ATPase with chaperone activity